MDKQTLLNELKLYIRHSKAIYTASAYNISKVKVFESIQMAENLLNDLHPFTSKNKIHGRISIIKHHLINILPHPVNNSYANSKRRLEAIFANAQQD